MTTGGRRSRTRRALLLAGLLTVAAAALAVQGWRVTLRFVGPEASRPDAPPPAAGRDRGSLYLRLGPIGRYGLYDVAGGSLANFPASQRGQALGLQATMTYLGLTAGPALGGWLTDLFGWPAVFFINVPVGLVAVSISWRFIPRDTPSKVLERFDVAGAVLFMGGLVTLLLALNQES